VKTPEEVRKEIFEVLDLRIRDMSLDDYEETCGLIRDDLEVRMEAIEDDRKNAEES
jgi:hypothetical protein